MTSRYIFAILAFILLSLAANAQQCDFSPKCLPNIQSCGCGGTQTRYTLCDGGCSEWYPCSIADTETGCNDNLDNDCDSLIDCADPDCSRLSGCIDADQDTFTLATDCNDDDNSINPAAEEVCDGKDNNCDGTIDEGCDCIPGQQKGCGSGIGECRKGTQTCQQDGSWGVCTAIPPAPEVCDGKDNNCDGRTDEGCDCIDSTERQCGIDTGACEKGTETCIGGRWSACEGSISPKDEVCGNSLDDNCNGLTDEACEVGQEPEPGPAQPAEEPEAEPEPASGYTRLRDRAIPQRECIDLDGDGFGTDCVKGPDCDDDDAAINLDAVEICNNRDDNCDSMIDEHLTRACGMTDTGICTFGTERCISGVWTGCDAIFPSEELCDNSLDDNCNGETDEDCNLDLSKDELALQQYLNIMFGRGNYDWDAYLEKHRQTGRFVSIRKSSVISDERTAIRIEIIPIRAMKNMTIFEYIPKFVAHSTDEIKFSIQPEIIREDPLVAWHFAELDEKTEISYEVIGEIEDAAFKTSTITIAEGSEPMERAWYFDLIPLLIIPVIGFIFIFLVEMAHKRRK